MKTLEIKTTIVFNLVVANNTVLSFFFLFFITIWLYFLILVVIAQIFNLTAELAITIGIPTKESKAEMGTHLVTTEAKISKCSI